MSGELCVNCGELVQSGAETCPNCGAAIVRSRPGGVGNAGLSPLSPVVFAVAGLAVGVVATLAFNLAVGIPLGLLGGGIAVWMLMRSRRLS